MSRRVVKAHTLHLSELPVKTGGIRIELYCPSGCVKGYLWSGEASNDDYVRSAAQIVADGHRDQWAGVRL